MNDDTPADDLSNEDHLDDLETEDEMRPGRGSWLAMLDIHADVHGFHTRLGARHGALFTEDGETLLVTFERGEAIRSASDAQLPLGLSVAGREGWSHLCLYSEGETWFRDADVYAFMDDLIDDGFFDDYDRVVFYGAGVEGYAAATFSVASPGASVMLIRPQATQDPRVTEWDERFPEARRTSFTDRYGYAPAMMEAAQDAVIIYDPAVPEDAMHAALFTRKGVSKYRCRFLGRRPEVSFEHMDILVPMIRAMGRGRLDSETFHRLYRKRRDHQTYLRRVLAHLEDNDRVWLIGLWGRAAFRTHPTPKFRRAARWSVNKLKKYGRSLPPATEADEVLMDDLSDVDHGAVDKGQPETTGAPAAAADQSTPDQPQDHPQDKPAKGAADARARMQTTSAAE